MGFIGVQPATVPLTSSDITDGIISTSKIANDAVDNTKLDLTDNYAFTGTISGAGDLEKVSSSTATQTGLTNLQITLPTTTDFTALKLFVRGVKSTTATNSYWAITLGNASGTALTGSSDYYYAFDHVYSNGSSSATSYYFSFGADYAKLSGLYVGDGSSDVEMNDFEFTIYSSNDSSRSTRIQSYSGYEKRHNDAYVSVNQGAIYRNGAEVNANLNLFVNTGAVFTSYGYGLYKAKA